MEKLQDDLWICLVRPRSVEINSIHQSNLLNSIYFLCLSSALYIQEVDKSRAAHKSVQECFSVRSAVKVISCPVSTDLNPSVKLNLSSSFFSLRLLSSFSAPDIVHENLKMGSDGESDQASGTSSDEVQSPTGVCLRNRGSRRISAEVSSPPPCLQTFMLPLCFSNRENVESLATVNKL